MIFTGAGRAFCAGADLSMGGETFSRGGSDVAGVKDVPRDGGGLVSLRIFECKKPVIGAINGPAVGVGVTMTLPMDIRLSSDTAKFGFVFARRGIITEACSSWFLPRVVGISRATEWVFTGRMILADEEKNLVWCAMFLKLVSYLPLLGPWRARLPRTRRLFRLHYLGK